MRVGAPCTGPPGADRQRAGSRLHGRERLLRRHRRDTESLATIDRALELGVTLLDTAESYGPFANEQLLGKALVGRRDAAVLATKTGVEITDDGSVLDLNGRPEYVRRAPVNRRARVLPGMCPHASVLDQQGDGRKGEGEGNRTGDEGDAVPVDVSVQAHRLGDRAVLGSEEPGERRNLQRVEERRPHRASDRLGCADHGTGHTGVRGVDVGQGGIGQGDECCSEAQSDQDRRGQHDEELAAGLFDLGQPQSADARYGDTADHQLLGADLWYQRGTKRGCGDEAAGEGEQGQARVEV
ncbi:aldo/keto reductase [Streptomyces sp. NPDC088178]|uniref:aldo/keto reductase n=1 Tax=Streptomyces sp. NPDC088178 TaxID=3365836 RepID=UPI0037FE164E